MSKTKLVFPDPTPPSGKALKLVGSYQLVDTHFPPDIRKVRGENPLGMIVYDPNGYMTVQIAPGRDYKPLARPPMTPDETFDVLPGFVSYFGTYEVNWDEQIVIHNRVFMMPPLPLEAPFVRKFNFLDDNTVQLRPLESENVLTWSRLT